MMKVITASKAPTFWLISDPHLIADDLHDAGARFQQMQATSAGKDLYYQELALKAFVRKLVKSKQESGQPDALIVTGDLTFNGAQASAVRFAEIFAPLEEAGIALLPVAGNHDIYDGWARKFAGEKEIRVDQISPQDWKQIFKSSYDLAIAQDPSSLAYSVNLNEHWRLILADSNLYGNEFSYSHPVTRGEIPAKELAWIESQLKEARKAGQDVLFFMHHNLYHHNSVVFHGFTLTNAKELQELLTKYGARCAFSGHIHAQHVMSGWIPVPEVVSSCFAEADEGYGIVSLTASELHYRRQSFDIENYLSQAEKHEADLADFHKYLKKVFFDANRQLIKMQAGGKFRQGDLEMIEKLVFQMHWDFFTGQSYKSDEYRAQIAESAPYRELCLKAPGLVKYLNSLYESTQPSDRLDLEWND